MYECAHQWQCPLFKRCLHKWCAEDCEMILSLEYIDGYNTKFLKGGASCPVLRQYGNHKQSRACDGCGGEHERHEGV